MESKLDSFERLDRMLASAEARRNNALHDIDRHRQALGERCVSQSRKSRTQTFETSRLARPLLGPSRDERASPAGQSSQRKDEQRPEDEGKSALCEERVAARLEHPRLE